MLKLAEPEDKELFVKLCSQRVEEVFDEFMDSPREEKIILFNDDVGVFVGMAFNSSKGKIATDVLWWVKPEERGQNKGSELLDAFEFWARKVGCDVVVMSSLHAEVGKEYFEEKGYALKDVAYVKEL